MNDWFNKHKLDIISVLGAIAGAIIIYFLLSSFIFPKETDLMQEISYTEYWQLIEDGKIDTVYYSPSSEYMTVTLLNDETQSMSRKERDEYTYNIKDKRKVLYPGYTDFRKDLLEKDVNVKLMENSDIFSVIINGSSLLLTILFFVFMMKMMSQTMQKTSEKDLIQRSDVKFDDIIGHEEILDDVKFIAELIKNPKLGDEVGAEPPKGLLLEGPPGTGKTLLAKAIAGEAGVPFLYQNASGLIEMFVGLGAKRVRDLFKIARKHAPCIIFIDEIDAIGGSRRNSKGTSENDQTINALLQEMDGFSGREGIFIIAATNRADDLDEALVRSRRFDRRITVNPPNNWEVRRDLFNHYLKDRAVDDTIDIDAISRQTAGFTGADIAAICNEASITALMHNKTVIDKDCIEEAIDKKIFHGNRSKREQHDQDRNIVAYHEAGHAVMSALLGEPIARASIQSTISGVGGAVFNEDKDSLFRTNMDFKNRVLIAYAGTASEEIKFGNPSTGAGNDITQATQVLIQYVEKFGFDKSFGLLDVSVLGKEHLVNSDTIMEKISRMSREYYEECLNMLKERYADVETVAKLLLEKETVPGEVIMNMVRERKENLA